MRARNAIAAAMGIVCAEERAHQALPARGATFVTLTQDERLRGCIGTLEAFRPLDEDVRANALAAAFRDPRFAPLARDEFHVTRVEVSLLQAPQPMTVRDEAQALRELVPHEDGVILRWNGRSATFLPQVWESLPQPQEFLRQLKRKAGLPADFWAHDVVLMRYAVSKWKERTLPERGAAR